jgi:hypothetical protein
LLITYGDTQTLKDSPWYMLELRSEDTIEPTLRRLGNAVPGIFAGDPVEFFIPVVRRDLDVFEMRTGNLIFARSKNFQALLRLKTVTGIVCLLTEGESNRPTKAIPIDDEYVQGIIKEAEAEWGKQGLGIEVGSFVRILNGATRDYCGHVEIINDGEACVRVDLKTKSLLIETPLRNLLNLSHVPEDQRVFYFCDLVEELSKDGFIGLVAEDLKLDENAPTPENITEGDGVEEPRRHSRQRTVTALVKRMILIDKEYDPMTIAKAVVKSLKKKDIKAPKNLFIVYCIIKDNLLKNHFQLVDPTLTNYREVIHKCGKQYKFSANDIAKLDQNLGIPVITVEVCKDGRSREARLKSKLAKEAAALPPAPPVKKPLIKKKEPAAKKPAGPVANGIS